LDEEGVVERGMGGEMCRGGTVFGMSISHHVDLCLCIRARMMIGQDVELEGESADVLRSRADPVDHQKHGRWKSSSTWARPLSTPM
jgi:hypothetical protein